ncbi:MAG: CoB--CoM heterodisulfide reductase iron-sulfur subunit A family protein [Thermoflexales bacterium]|nr:CoB--CoM heterodisulfide reductase iron-sulfur subunit A family protein [Thermoflexales bacterium]
MSNESTVLIYGTNLGGYRAAYAIGKSGHKFILLNRGAYVDEMKYQALAQLPLDFCWICGHMPQRAFKASGAMQDYYNARLLELSGQAGHFHVKFKKRDQVVNNFACTECGQCIAVCPVELDAGAQGLRAIRVVPEAGWENIYVIDWEHCTRCGQCEKICPTGALKLDRLEEVLEADVGAIILADTFEEPGDEDLRDFGLGQSPSVIRNAELGRRSFLTNFVRDGVRLPSGKIPRSFGIVITPHFNRPGVEYENYNLSVSAIYRAVRLKEILPEADVTVFLRDYRGIGKGHHQWYQKALAAGVRVERAETLTIAPDDGEQAVIHYTCADGQSHAQPVELAILVTGQSPPSQMAELTQVTGVQADENGFCRIRPFSSCETDVDGILAVGELTGAKGNPETVWEGCAALIEMQKYLGEKNFAPDPPPPLRNVTGEAVKVGVFICNCFGQFDQHIDLPALEQRVRALPGVAHVEIIPACCTPPTIKATAERIKQSGVNRLVLASCTPLQKKGKFDKAVMMAGLSPLLCEYLRFREDVVQVHTDRDKMLEKSLALIRGGVEKVRRGQHVAPPVDAFTPRALVIGGGLAGLTAAAEIAASGFPVALVEREKELGGYQKALDKEQRQYVQKLVANAESANNVTCYTQAQVSQLEGYAGNYHVVVDAPAGRVKLDVGVIIVATGAREYVPKRFLYGQDPRVLTQSEIGARLGELAGRVVMIQCVGSRDADTPYCSRLCCNQALRNALALREKGAEVCIFYRDIASYGKVDYYRLAKEAGVRFVRFPDDDYPQVHTTGDGLEVASGGQSVQADWVVLSTGIVPDAENNQALSRLLNYPLDYEGFFSSDISNYPYEEAIKKLTKPFELTGYGIFPVGLAHSPRSFEETLLTARDAAGRARVVIGKQKMPPPNAMFVAAVNESLCMGCGVCVDICPYGARYLDELRRVIKIRPFLCDSCGSCVAICPNDASYLRDFMSEQSIAALDALLIGGQL